MIGLQIIVSEHATEEALRWQIKPRSRRLHKKLTKRLGEQVYRKPCAYRTPAGLVVHPEIHAELKRRAKEGTAS